MGLFGSSTKVDIATVILNDLKAVQADLKSITVDLPVIKHDVRTIRDDQSLQAQRMIELDKRVRALEDNDMREKAGWTGPQKIITALAAAVPIFGLMIAALTYLKNAS